MSDVSLAAEPLEDTPECEGRSVRERQTIEIAEGAPWNAVEDVMLRRRSIRKYRSRQVPAHLIRRMLEVGRYAPSQGNCQPWKFVVVRDARMIREMEEFCVETCKKLSRGIDYANHPKGSFKHFVTRAKAKALNRLDPGMLHPVPVTVVTAIAQGRFAVFHRAPTVILLLMDRHGIGTPEIDIGICGTNIVLAAQSYGLGTCWVGFSKLLNRSREWRARLGAEERYEIVEGITVGYPVGDPSRLIDRETHEIAWFEDGKREILY